MSLSQTMYWVCSDVLSLILQLRNSRELPAPDVLQRRAVALFETMMQNGREARIADPDMLEAKFALAAFADEVIYASNWQGKTQWLSNPLQLQFFNINTAGDSFFANLDALYGQKNRVHVAQIYYLCLALGFQGRYRMGQQDQLSAVVDGVGNFVTSTLGPSDVLAPNAARKDGGRSVVQRELPFLALSFGFLALAIVVVVVLRLLIGFSSDSAVLAIQKLVGASQ